MRIAYTRSHARARTHTTNDANIEMYTQTRLPRIHCTPTRTHGSQASRAPLHNRRSRLCNSTDNSTAAAAARVLVWTGMYRAHNVSLVYINVLALYTNVRDRLTLDAARSCACISSVCVPCVRG